MTACMGRLQGGRTLTAAEFETLDEREVEGVLRWRLRELIGAGYACDAPSSHPRRGRPGARARLAATRLSAHNGDAHPAVTEPDRRASVDTDPSLGGSLVRLIDPAGVQHLGYATARRTLCLERLVTECSPNQPVTVGECAACTQVRKRMSRAGSRD
jgi:hypothetical protein